jgi:hypothetical protein
LGTGCYSRRLAPHKVQPSEDQCVHEGTSAALPAKQTGQLGKSVTKLIKKKPSF